MEFTTADVLRIESARPLMPPLVSIVIPAYISTPRQADLLAETLATVEQQTFTEYEVLLVDDGSPVQVDSVVARSDRLQIRRQPNGGSAAARNTGIAASRGEFLVFLDGDDHLLPHGLETAVSALQCAPDAGFAVGPREEMTFDGDPVEWLVPVPPAGDDIYAALLAFDWYIIPPSSAIFRRRVVEDVGGFRDPWGADDLDFYLRVSRRYRACCYQHPPVTRYRRYSRSSSRDGERMLESVRVVYARHWRFVRGDAALEGAHRMGLDALTRIFVDCLEENVRDRLRAGDRDAACRAARLLSAEDPDRWRRLHEAADPIAGILADPLAS